MVLSTEKLNDTAFRAKGRRYFLDFVLEEFYTMRHSNAHTGSHGGLVALLGQSILRLKGKILATEIAVCLSKGLQTAFYRVRYTS